MSTNLFWRPVNSGKCLSKMLKYAFQSGHLLDNNNSILLGNEHIQFLRGVWAVSTDEELQQDCELLINQIESGVEIELYIE